MTGPMLTQPEIDALLHGETEMTTEQRAQSFENYPKLAAHIEHFAWHMGNISMKRWGDFLTELSATINSAIAAERLQCRLLAANYQQWVVSDGQIGLLTNAVSQQVASEIAQAIAGRDEGN